mmetsp:Transcript_17212/g.52274  ORF Transcript_17212/g.52274 Transcript_17212/m.52274 type:complete len:516 (-) Transcript_17212:174-1721(-)
MPEARRARAHGEALGVAEQEYLLRREEGHEELAERVRRARQRGPRGRGGRGDRGRGRGRGPNEKKEGALLPLRVRRRRRPPRHRARAEPRGRDRARRAPDAAVRARGPVRDAGGPHVGRDLQDREGHRGGRLLARAARETQGRAPRGERRGVGQVLRGQNHPEGALETGGRLVHQGDDAGTEFARGRRPPVPPAAIPLVPGEGPAGHGRGLLPGRLRALPRQRRRQGDGPRPRREARRVLRRGDRHGPVGAAQVRHRLVRRSGNAAAGPGRRDGPSRRRRQRVCRRRQKSSKAVCRAPQVHRDLKLENVLVKANGHLAICDFGTSKTLRRTPTDGAPPAPASDDAARTRGLEPLTKSIIGTPAYMAPEMLLEQPYSYSVDWWALGVTYFTMLRARLPFDGGRNHEEEKMLWRIVKSRPRYDVTWQSETRECLQLLLQKVPKTRICSLTQLKTQPIYADFAWDAVEAETVAPPFVPRFGCRAVVQTGVPSRDFGDAAAATRIFRGGVVAAPPRLRT